MVVGCAVVLGQDECAVWIQSLLLEIKLLNRNLVVWAASYLEFEINGMELIDWRTVYQLQVSEHDYFIDLKCSEQSTPPKI